MSRRRPRVERKSAFSAPRASSGRASTHVAREPERGLLAQRDGALLPALAAYVHELLFKVDVGEVEVDRLAAAQAGRVDELHERAVAQCERAVARERLEQAVDLVGLRCVRQAAWAARACDRLGHPAGAEREAQERAHGGQPARDRGGREPARAAAPQLCGVLGEDAGVDLVEREAPILEPVGERRQVEAVRPPRRVRERRTGQKTLDCGASLHDRHDSRPCDPRPA